MRILYSLERSILSFIFIAAICQCNAMYGKNLSCNEANHCTVNKPKSELNSFHLLTVSAPPDLTITLRGIGRCDTVFPMPPATLGAICAPISFMETKNTFTSLNTNGGNLFFPTGVFQVIYTFTDACGTFRDTTKVTVFDATPPKVICLPDHVVSLNNLGEAIINASSFDGGSTDDCGHVYFKAKRMNIPPQYTCTTSSNPLYRFDDVVRLCCNDVDSVAIPIILRVYDVYPGSGPVVDSLYRGHYGECMVMVSVVDKLAPNVYCPSNVTVSCGTDLDSVLHSARPTIFDNCTMSRVDSLITYKLNSCGAGTVERRYTGTDSRGQFTSCTQIITVLKNTTFNGLDTNQLLWPASRTVFACRVNADPSITGVPRVKDAECDLVAVSYKDEVYSFGLSGVCAKILRKWEAINWCVYNRNLSPNPNIASNGYYSFIQELKIMDTIPPILAEIKPQTVGIQTSNCAPAFVNLISASATDCSSSTALIYSFTIDFNSNGSIDVRGNGKDPSGVYPIGIHQLCYIVEDSCGNQSNKCVALTIRDAKSPSAALMSGISTSLTQMSNGIMVMVNASIFNVSSSDNCSAASQLIYSFSSNPNDTIRTYTCDSVGRRNVTIYVWDEAGNSTVVQTYIVIGDESNLCPNTLTGTINLSGIIRDQNNNLLSDVTVAIDCNGKKIEANTSQFGSFAFNSIPKNNVYSLNAKSSEDYLHQVTTSDIVKIQKYILGIQDIKNPYELIAADVDLNGSISSRDISDLRKLILGSISEFSHKKSFVFIDEKYKFNNPSQPFSEFAKNSTCTMQSGTTDQQVNFLGIKLGDVQRSTKLGIRNAIDKIALQYRKTNNGIEIYSSEEMDIEGFQMEFLFDGLCFIKEGIQSELINEANLQESIFLQHNSLKICFVNAKGLRIEKNKTLLFIPFQYNDPQCAIFRLSSTFSNILINKLNSQEFEIQLEEENIKVDKGFTVLGIQSDPFHGNMNIRLQLFNDQQISYSAISNSGKIVFRKTKEGKQGIYDIHLQREEIPIAGVYFIHIESKFNNDIIKLNTF